MPLQCSENCSFLSAEWKREKNWIQIHIWISTSVYCVLWTDILEGMKKQWKKKKISLNNNNNNSACKQPNDKLKNLVIYREKSKIGLWWTQIVWNWMWLWWALVVGIQVYNVDKNTKTI